jgi:hypothetical protein
VVADEPIAEPYPRGEEFRLSPAYAQACRRVSQALHGSAQAQP